MSEEENEDQRATVARCEKRVVSLLSSRPGLSCTEIGETLWGGINKRQSYARPAGRIMKRLLNAGRVREHWEPRVNGPKRRVFYLIG